MMSEEGTVDDAKSFGLTPKDFENLKNTLGKNPTRIELELASNIMSSDGCLNSGVNSFGRMMDVNDTTVIGVNDDLVPVLKRVGSEGLVNVAAVNYGQISTDQIKKNIKAAITNNVAPINKAVVNFNQPIGDFSTESRFSLGMVASKELSNGLWLSTGETVLELPKKLVVDTSSEVKLKAPKRIAVLNEFDIDLISEPEDLREVAMSLLANENLSSDDIFSETNSDSPSSDASMINAEGVDGSLVLAVKSSPRYFNASPMKGIAISAVEAARDIVVSGGRPVSITNDIEIINKDSDELNWQLSDTYEGLKKISSSLKTVIASNNISFQEGAMKSDDANPVISTIGMVGTLEKGRSLMTSNFKNKGDLIFILGESVDCISSSEYLVSYHNNNQSSAPYFNLDKEIQLQGTLSEVIEKDLVNAAHSIGKGGLYMALTKMGLKNELGFDIVTDSEVREDAFLFGEGQSRALVTVNEDQEDDFIEFMMGAGTQFTLLGHVTKGKTVVDDVHFGFMNEAKDVYENALKNTLNS